MAQPLRLLEAVRNEIRLRRLSYRTEEAYVDWIRRFVNFHGKRHPRDMGGAEVAKFLSHLASDRNVAGATQNQALAAILFLYKRVLNVKLPWIGDVVRASRPKRLPTVLSQRDAQRVLANLQGVYWLIGALFYGSGLRLTEALRLRVKDLELGSCRVVVRNGKGNKDRVTILSGSLVPHLKAHLAKVRALHDQAIRNGHGGVALPYALERKYPHAHLEWGWQYVFPAARPSLDPRSNTYRRHHLFEDTVQELMGHKDVSSTQIYTHVMEKGKNSVKSPFDVGAPLRESAAED